LDSKVKSKVKDLIQKAIHFDPTERITIEDMIKEMQSIVDIYAKKNSSRLQKPNTPQRSNTITNMSEQDQKMENCMDKYKCVELRAIAKKYNVDTMIYDNGKRKKRQMNKSELCNELKDKLDLRPNQQNVNMRPKKKCVGNNCENNVC
jgi:serine/threonine protein kinase